MEPRKNLPIFLIFGFTALFFSFLDMAAAYISGATSIAFATWLRSSYSFDIYSLPTSGPPDEVRLTDGVSVNFNGHFPAPLSVSVLPNAPNPSLPATYLIYVTERNGSSSVYLDAVYQTPLVSSAGSRTGHRVASEAVRVGCKQSTESTQSSRSQVLLVGDQKSDRRASMKDKPTLVGTNLIYISTHEDPGKPRASWTAVYSTDLVTGSTRRLTPHEVADFSPAVSPSGVWTAVASYGEDGWQGDIEDLGIDIYVFLTQDGSNRVKLLQHGGWPTWANESTLYFHRRAEDGWWGVFRANFDIKDGNVDVDSVVTRRVTPPGLHAFTPAASVADPRFIAVATRRPESEYRQVELYDVLSNRFIMSTRSVTPNAHHYNPFISYDSKRLGYHKCRGATNENDLVLEHIKGPTSQISLFQVDGSFPSYSPDGKRIAYVKLTTEPMAHVDSPGLYVMNSDGSRVKPVLMRPAFATAWDWKRKGVVYTSVGPIFASESSKADIVSVNVDDESPSIKTLTLGGGNNAFPSPSPDGKWVLFRSGRSGHKNLYIMDALNGESGELRRVTEGPWTDTMGNWSPDGEWIAFSSDRENPGSGSFELFKIHPNGTGLQKVFRSGLRGRVNHPWFSPDGKHIVFVSDYAGISAEPISNPHHFQPYGDVFVIKSDGSGIRRLTHNSYEDGTPTWSPKFSKPTSAEWPTHGSQCSFEDCHWLS